MSSKVASAAPSVNARRALAVSALAGILSALLAAFYLHSYEQAVSGGERISILRALKPIERGTLLTDDLLVEAVVPASYVEGRAVRAAERGKVRGIRTAASLDTQDALMWSDLAVSQERRDLSSLIQPGNRAVTVQAAASGRTGAGDGSELIRPGDYVDVLATLQPKAQTYDSTDEKLVSVVLLQRILVLAVGAETDPHVLRAEELGGNDLRDTQQLTLSLKIEEAQLLALARERGHLSVVVRQPDDTRIVESAPEMPVSSLFDTGFRNELQRRRAVDQRPIRLTAPRVSGRNVP